MRGLQYIGLIIGFLIGLYSFWKRKHRKFSRLQMLIGWGIAFGLVLLSLSPQTGDIIAVPLNMDRWNAVLFITSLILFVLFFYLISQNNATNYQLSRLIESLAVKEIDQEFPKGIDCDVLAIIPAYNEGDNIGGVLKKMPQTVEGLKLRCLVVVDGATDNTAEVARQHGAITITTPINRGGGAALRAGYKVALVKSNADIVVTLDADGQHLPEEIGVVIRPILNDSADLVNGSRVLGSHEAESQIRVAGVMLFNRLISFLMNSHITDSSNAFRAIRIETLRQITLNQDQFHTSELLIDAIKKGARVQEVPITILRRQSGETKKPKSLKYGWGYTKAIISTWLR